MTATGTASSSRQWWSRKPSSSPSPLLTDHSTLYAGSGISRSGKLMTPATTTKMSSNALTTSASKPTSSRFNLAAVLPSFATRSKKQPSLDIQSPPSQIRSLPTSPGYSSPTSARSPRLSRGANSGTSRASTDGPLTPDDDHITVPRASYQRSLMTLADFGDPFASDSPLNDRRLSSHSDKSLGKRLMSKVEGKSKPSGKIPATGIPSRKDSNRDRSATMPSRARTSPDALDTHFSHRAVDPQRQHSSPLHSPTSPTSVVTPPHRAATDNSIESPASNMLRKAKSSKPSLPWPDGPSSLKPHQRTNSSTSIAKESFTDGGRASKSSSRASSLAYPLSPTSPSHATHPSYSSTGSALAMPSSSHLSPRPPPNQELPPAPGPVSSFRARAETIASVCASPVSFSSSLSSLSFTSQPSPQDTVVSQPFSSLKIETSPGVVRRTSDSGSSASGSGGSHLRTPHSPALDSTPRAQQVPLPGSRPLPAPPAAPPPHRERTLSAASSARSLQRENSVNSNSIRTLRKQRSFHNASLQVQGHTQTLRHYSSFEPAPRSPPPSRPPPQDLPPLPPPSSPPVGKRAHSGKDVTSPRRKFFGAHKHDRERKPEPDTSATSPFPAMLSSPPPLPPPAAVHHSSSWYDETSAAEHITTPAPDVTQHIVPPAELLRLGAAWERESINASSSSSPPRPVDLAPSSPSWGSASRLPRSASLLSSRSRGRDPPFESPTPSESYTSLSPPPRRARPVTAMNVGAPITKRRTLSNASSTSKSGSSAGTGGGILIGPVGGGSGPGVQRKPSFLDMTARRSVSIELPTEQRDSFLELSRGMDSIDTIRESEASFQ